MPDQNDHCLLFTQTQLPASPIDSGKRKDLSEAYFGLKADVSNDGSFVVSYVSKIWLNSAPPFFIINGTKYSALDGSLKFIGITNSTGNTDNFGVWEARDIHYLADKMSVIASVKNYPYGIVTFSVKYIEAADSTAAPDVNQIICGFPGFKLQGARDDLGFLAYGGHYSGDTDKTIGRWNNDAKIPGGLEGSGPLAVFDKDGNTLLTTPLDNFMSISTWKDDVNNFVYWGIMGGVDQVPANFKYQVMMNYNTGINMAIASWGLIIQLYYNNTKQAEVTPDKDITTRYLGYWTDDGTFYNKAPITGQNYESTILSIQNEAITKTKLPYTYFQIDNWWCIKTGNKVKQWAGDPTTLPDGMSSLENKTQSKFLMYSGVWSSDNVYAKQNGGKYNFIIEGDTAVPDDPMFWDDLFSNAAEWGLVTYDQDGLDETLMNLNATKTDLNLASRWLNEMGSAAARYNISILYSDGYPRHLLQSIVNPAVTQTRVSPDYGKNKDQWKIGISSIFADALNLAPNKDSFRTIKKSSDFEEPHPELELVVSVLSRGPVGNGDGLGMVNKTVLSKCCGKDGRILRAQHPAKAIDAQIMQTAFQDGSGPDGEVWSTFTQISSVGFENAKYGVVFAAGQTKPFDITPKNTHLDYDFPKSKIYRWNAPYEQYDFNIGSKFTLTNCTLDNFCLYFTAPVIEFDGQEVVILGETDKWIHMPHQRVRQITKQATQLKMEIDGSPGEEIEIWITVNGKIAALATRADATGYAHFIYERYHDNAGDTKYLFSFSNYLITLFCICVFKYFS
ncbi:hypothetical protein LOTGIDRAFT_158730 [Lottia gigantea]|uniref:Uncharacterized protein n=1 Tax=Lottia gigantea TaxID=225164 RepID=V4CAF4_LOTGI|nr:hypothetical protein LOTGIDRAFT_158730 [Lottia gigantea]ESO98784.1 hypothetical protein LOTGIDRAFT_158730 [Lottia gigantea]